MTDKRVEESLFLVNDIPGVTAQGFFQPGDQVGDTRLVVNVLDEDLTDFNFRADNHGSAQTGEFRTYADLFVNNPLSYGDQLHLSFLYTFNPENSNFGSIRYNAPLFMPRLRGSVGVSTNDFVSENAFPQNDDSGTNNSLIITGESLVSDLSLSYIFRRSRIKNLSTELKFMDIASDLEIFTGTDSAATEDSNDVFNVSLTFNFDFLRQRARKLHIGSISLVHTDNAPILAVVGDANDDGFDNDQTQSRFFLTFDYSRLSFFNFPFTKSETRLVLKTSGQLATVPMTNVNQFSLTGPTRARAFDVNTTFFDDGFYFGADWIFKFPGKGGFSKVVQPFLFFDYAHGVRYSQLENEPSVTGNLSDIGIGLKISHKNLSGSLTYATPLEDDSGLQDPLALNDDQAQIDIEKNFYFELQYSF